MAVVKATLSTSIGQITVEGASHPDFVQAVSALKKKYGIAKRLVTYAAPYTFNGTAGGQVNASATETFDFSEDNVASQ